MSKTFTLKNNAKLVDHNLEKIYSKLVFGHGLDQQRSQGGGGGGGLALPIGMSTKMQNGKNTTFLALLKLCYALEWTK